MYWNNTEGQNSGRNVLEILTSGALTGSIRLHLKRTLASSGIGRFYWYAGLWKRVDSKTFWHSVVSRRRSKCFCPPSVMAEWGGLGRNVIIRGAPCYHCMTAQIRNESTSPDLTHFLFFFPSNTSALLIVNWMLSTHHLLLRSFFYATHLTLYGLQHLAC